MSSVDPHITVDEDDAEFDWEAAVREIDVACENAKNNPSSSYFSSINLSPPRNVSCLGGFSNFDESCKKKFGTCKQSTLDRFIGKVGGSSIHPVIDRSVGVDCKDDGAVEGGDEGVSCVGIDTDTAKTWIYPVNVPLRDYQLAIASKSLFSNTLVALPTGLGKTLIAAVVMYNYFRWFPEGKIVFAAPSRPLVVQQIEACHNIVGIPQEWTIDMTGQINPTERSSFWKSKRVFFVTPQVLEKDIQAGTCLVRHLVCLVIDEAHRALGNYSYSVAVRELMSIPVQLRIVALTATPGSKQQVIQRIIDNLHISTLEYRNESDPDVIPYVHNRKIELIEVALGKDAVDINKLLLEVIRPYVTRLSSSGLLPYRDYQTLSPPDLLNSRDKFRRAPPPDLPQNRYGEVEAYFAALITLYHIRKLLSSHGIKPAYEMLEEKMKQGSFARVMSKNEEIRKAKLLMQRSLSHGAPSPKLSKMLEVLVDHFKKNDPQNSRVIIFSNFRGSVRDIMSTLAIIGNLVKATEFIGQSSGKSLKGQSQKVQQAVLQKFRAGGYNVIVATSIGEEGLDIMEVDLVICFDANVSPLRMIQRMGRTGRKHDGRVVVLACEGSELKAYMRKQASGRAIRKHMHNGGINSFNFHPSPRMIPHIFKPEVQFVELSIDQYVPRGKKMKDDSNLQTPVFKEKITDEEAATLTKYFNPNNTWVPSLIAFPRFQAFPSRVHIVMHSNRTDMLIDSMQNLQALSFSRDSGVFSVENEVIMGQYSGVDHVEYEDNDKEGAEYEGNGSLEQMILDRSPSSKSWEKIAESGVSPIRRLRNDKKDCVENFQDQSPNGHSYLFGSDFVSVDALGKVLIMCVPSLTLKDVSHSDCTKASKAHLNYLDQNLYILKTSDQDCGEQTMECDTADCDDETLDLLVIKASSLQVEDSRNNGNDADLSPRLTNMIQSGVVPESPASDHGLLNGNRIVEVIDPNISATKSCANLPTESLSQRESKTSLHKTASQRKISLSPKENDVQTPLPIRENIARLGRRNVVSSVSPKANTPLANLTNSCCSNDWFLTSGEKSESLQVRKFKRLRKVGDPERTMGRKTKKGSSLVTVTNHDKPFSGVSPNRVKHVDGSKKKRAGHVRAFIEEEAEVSSEAEISNDEEDEPGNSSYEDSFIDDRINPTASGSLAEASTSRVDMMAVYRRSLLSQSPIGIESCSHATSTPDYGASASRKNEGGGSFLFKTHSLQASHDPGNCSDGRLSECLQTKPEKISANPCATTDLPGENATKLESRKRKLSFCQAGSIPVINLDREFYSQSEAPKESLFHQDLEDKSDVNGDMFFDDQFFATLDLDAVEAQAASLLGNKPSLSTQKHNTVPESINLHNSPSFDLGIL